MPHKPSVEEAREWLDRRHEAAAQGDYDVTTYCEARDTLIAAATRAERERMTNTIRDGLWMNAVHSEWADGKWVRLDVALALLDTPSGEHKDLSQREYMTNILSIPSGDGVRVTREHPVPRAVKPSVRLADDLFDIANEMAKGDDADIRWLRDQAGVIRDAAHALLTER